MTQFINKLSQVYPKLDRYLLINKPWIWETRAHFAIILGAVMSLLGMLLLDWKIEVDGVLGMQGNMVGGILGTAVLCTCVFWSAKYMRYNGYIEYTTLNERLVKQQFIITALGIVAMLFPVVLIALMWLQIESSEMLHFIKWGVNMTTLSFIIAFLTTLILHGFKSLGTNRMIKLGVLYAMIFVGGVIMFELSGFLLFCLLLIMPVCFVFYFMLHQRSDYRQHALIIYSLGHLITIATCIGIPTVFGVTVAWTTSMFNDWSWAFICPSVCLGIYIYLKVFFYKHHEFYLAYVHKPQKN